MTKRTITLLIESKAVVAQFPPWIRLGQLFKALGLSQDAPCSFNYKPREAMNYSNYLVAEERHERLQDTLRILQRAEKDLKGEV